jgi:hypothetical protein
MGWFSHRATLETNSSESLLLSSVPWSYHLIMDRWSMIVWEQIRKTFLSISSWKFVNSKIKYHKTFFYIFVIDISFTINWNHFSVAPSIIHWTFNENCIFIKRIGLYHPLDGITNPKYKLLLFITANFLQRKVGTIFNRDKVLPSSALFTADSLPLIKNSIR